jgi:hypothetical protein
VKNTGILILLLIGGFFDANAQEITQTVRGKIVDQESQAPLPGATVRFISAELNLGCISDSSGWFELKNVPIGRQSFKITFIGYEDFFISEVQVTSGKELSFEIELKESLKTLEVIEVTANTNKPINTMATTSVRVFSVEETSRFAGSFNDPARMVQSLAGVSTTGDLTNELVIRGNSSRGVLWRLEGVEIPNPNHFRSGEGSTGGGISILSSNMLGTSDFYTGAFPAEYGNATSGVFDMRLRKGNNKKREYSVELGVLGTEVSLEGPFSRKSKSSYLIGYRYSTLDMLTRIGFDLVGDIVPAYQDLAFNFSLPTKKLGDFTIFGLGGLSKALLTADRDSSLWQTYDDREEEANIQKTGVIGLTHLYRFAKKRSYLKTVISGSYTGSHYVEGYIDDLYSFVQEKDRVYNYPTFRTSMTYNSKLSKRHTLRIGGIYSYNAFDLLRQNFYFSPDDTLTTLDAEGNTSVIQTYVHWKYRLGEDTDLLLGSHFTYFLLNDNYSVDPRLNFIWGPGSRQRFLVGIGLHSKLEAISIYMAEKELGNGVLERPNENLELTKALHFVGGYEFSFTKNFDLAAEVYYQYLFDVPILDTLSYISAINFGAGFTNLDFENKGSGYNYGIELTIHRHFSRGWFVLLTMSFFDSKYRAGDGVERNTAFNSNYLTNLVGGKEFLFGKKKNQRFNLNGRMIWKGGNRVAPIDLEASKQKGETVYDVSRIYEDRLSDYMRLDISLSYQLNRPSFSWTVIADVQNVTNRLNVGGEFYDPVTNKIEVITQLGILPILKFRIEF